MREPSGCGRTGAKRLHQLERDADASKVLLRVATVVALGVDDGEGVRQFGVGLMMVGDDQIEPQRLACAAASTPRMPQSTEMTR